MHATATISQTEAGQGHTVPIQILRGDEDKGGLLGVILGPLYVDKEPGSWLKDGGHAFISWAEEEPRRKIKVGANVHDAFVTADFFHDAMVTVSFTSA